MTLEEQSGIKKDRENNKWWTRSFDQLLKDLKNRRQN